MLYEKKLIHLTWESSKSCFSKYRWKQASKGGKSALILNLKVQVYIGNVSTRMFLIRSIIMHSLADK